MRLVVIAVLIPLIVVVASCTDAEPQQICHDVSQEWIDALQVEIQYIAVAAVPYENDAKMNLIEDVMAIKTFPGGNTITEKIDTVVIGQKPWTPAAEFDFVVGMQVSPEADMAVWITTGLEGARLAIPANYRAETLMFPDSDDAGDRWPLGNPVRASVKSQNLTQDCVLGRVTATD